VAGDFNPSNVPVTVNFVPFSTAVAEPMPAMVAIMA